MNPDKQNLAIAKACGWTPYAGQWVAPNSAHPQQLPDYVNDLNAMHEAEKSLYLDDNLRSSYSELLYVMCSGESSFFNYISCSSSKRAEAFLKTLDLWVDGKEAS